MSNNSVLIRNNRELSSLVKNINIKKPLRFRTTYICIHVVYLFNFFSRYPVVGVGVIRWIENTVTEPSYFKLSTDSCPTHLAILDEVAAVHCTLHQQILTLLIRLFESKQDELEILVQLEMKKMLLDRMVNLLSRGCVVPVVKYIKQCWGRGDTDISLIRYFVTEVLETITHPYSPEFVLLFLPMVENEEITGTMRGEGDNDPVSEFIGKQNSKKIKLKKSIHTFSDFSSLQGTLYKRIIRIEA